MFNWLKSLEKKQGLKKRYDITLEFMEESLPSPANILDLGTPNELSIFLNSQGYEVQNTKGEDLDNHPEVVSKDGFDAVTAFEILEHLVNPMGVLKEIKADKLFASIPLDLWFSPAYRNKNDSWDQHFHEFEDWQFDWLLEKSGWKVLRRKKWSNPSYVPGIRPILRALTPRYYLVEAEKV